MTKDREFPTEETPAHRARLVDPNRLAALARTRLMDSETEAVFDRTVRIATEAIGVPVGLLSLVDGQRQFFKAQIGLPEETARARQTPLSHSFCQYVVSLDTPLTVTDAREHPLLRENMAIEDLDVIAYAGVPVHAPDGQPLGSFCAIDSQPREWTARELRILTGLSELLEAEFRLRHEVQMRQMLAEELHHRVKNLFTITGGMITMTARMTETKDEMTTALQGRLAALSQAHDIIRPAITGEAVSSGDAVVSTLLATLIEPHVVPGGNHMTLDGPNLILGASCATQLALVVHELATNAAKYGALSVPEGRLSIVWREDAGQFRLSWRETGGPASEWPPQRQGFGSRLISMTVTGQLRGTLKSDWLADGPHHEIAIPMEELAR
ncbi:HWE histidine kinase domain-containing protein [Marinovum sp.]|uniref:HWE histidine kinase domain-containing protein n=1 Tax=Marinovum sp. TaxID=2024839 RepID=UPI002B26DE20|nr:HWE histidine kinase domain-containing protein [Marinovum sp.]